MVSYDSPMKKRRYGTKEKNKPYIFNVERAQNRMSESNIDSHW